MVESAIQTTFTQQIHHLIFCCISAKLAAQWVFAIDLFSKDYNFNNYFLLSVNSLVAQQVQGVILKVIILIWNLNDKKQKINKTSEFGYFLLMQYITISKIVD